MNNFQDQLRVHLSINYEIKIARYLFQIDKTLITLAQICEGSFEKNQKASTNYLKTRNMIFPQTLFFHFFSFNKTEGTSYCRGTLLIVF